MRMEDAIKEGKRLCREIGADDEEAFIKYEVAAWAWAQMKQTENIKDPVERLLETLILITK